MDYFKLGLLLGQICFEEGLGGACELSQIERIKNTFFYVVNRVIAYVNGLKVLATIPRSARTHWLDSRFGLGFCC